jgi:hypothetical protein
MNASIDILEKPIARIKKTCDLLGISSDFERRLPALEAHLKALAANGETREERLAVSGMAFMKQS